MCIRDRIWTLLLGLLGVHLMETVRKKQKLWVSLPGCAAVAAAGALLGTLGMTDYYGAGVLTVFAFYMCRGRKWWCLLGPVSYTHLACLPAGSLAGGCRGAL